MPHVCVRRKAFATVSDSVVDDGTSLYDSGSKESQCQSGWNAFKDACYLWVGKSSNFPEAKEDCERRDAQLVTIGSSSENKHVEQLCGQESCWLGLKRPFGTDSWEWENGTHLGSTGAWAGYTHWDEGEPQDFEGEDEDVAFMNFWGHLDEPDRGRDEHLGRWHDGPKELRIQFVCEQPPLNGCLKGWDHFQGACYFSPRSKRNHQDAVEFCKAFGAWLVSINSAVENLHVQKLCGKHSCWLGLSEHSLGLWLWSDGGSIGKRGSWTAYEAWDYGEPNNMNSSWSTSDLGIFMNFWDLLGEPAPWETRPGLIFQQCSITIWGVLKVLVTIVLLFQAYCIFKSKSIRALRWYKIFSGACICCIALELAVCTFALVMTESPLYAVPWERFLPFCVYLILAGFIGVFFCSVSMMRAGELHTQLCVELSQTAMIRSRTTAAVSGTDAAVVGARNVPYYGRI